ncbi:MAG: tripartite tricarboxylate transporter TctB family protein [Bacillota bacterium]
MWRKWVRSPDWILAIVALAIGIAIFVLSTQLPDFGLSLESPGITPAFAGAVVVICSLLIGLGAIRKASCEGELRPLPNVRALLREESVRHTVVLFVATILYALLVPRLHFLLTTILFLIGTFWVYRAAKPWAIVGISVVVGLSIQFVFARLFRVLLP